MDVKMAERLTKLPPYLFAEIDKAKRKAKAEGRDIIDFGVGDPDIPTPDFIINRLYEAAQDRANHRYALDQGLAVLRKTISSWYSKKFNVVLDPDKEVLPLIGSKEGIAHLPMAVINPGDLALVPDPCYPPYKGGVILAGGEPYLMPLLEKNKFLPDLSAVPSSVVSKAKLLYVNYPNNPTGACADENFYKEVVAFALKNDLLVVSDLAYSEMSYDGFRPMSMLEIKGGRECVIEFHSLSKTYNMTGWRIGWACGNAQAVGVLAKLKSNLDSGIFNAIQIAAVRALQEGDESIAEMCALYQQRRDVLVDGLASLGWSVSRPKATFYVWVRIPDKFDSTSYAGLLLEKTDIIVTPGVGLGSAGEGYIRMALTVPVDRIKQALVRIKKAGV